MFDIPERYHKNSIIEPKTFILREMKKAEKDRIKKSLLKVHLIWQIDGEDIKSVINEDYNYAVIMGFEVQVSAIKDTPFLAELFHRLVKAPCVVRFYDSNSEVYSFAYKRLNKNDHTQVVIEERLETPVMSIHFSDDVSTAMKEHLLYEKMKNKTDKLSLYTELITKAFIISNQKLYTDILLLLDSKVWYNMEDTLSLFKELIELKRLNDALRVEKLSGERARIIGEIKKAIEVIKDYAQKRK